MPPRKLIDITPPRSKTKAKEETVAKKQARKNTSRTLSLSFPKGKILLVPLGVFIILLGLFSLHTVFARAKITLEPVSREVTLKESFFVQPQATGVNSTTKAIPGTIVAKERSGTKVFSATGSENTDTKAQGTIRVFNNQAKTQILIATTRFISEEGKLFRSLARISIASQGFTDVEVAAAESGSEYNIGPSNFSLPGLLGSASYTAVYGKSFAAMAGGGSASNPVVTENDISKAQDELSQELIQQAREDLTKSVSLPIALLEKSIKEQVLEISSSVGKGATVSQFSSTGKVRAQALSFNDNDIEVLAREVLVASLNEGEKLQEGTLKITQQDTLYSSVNQQGTLKLEITAKVYQDIGREELASKLLGKNQDQAEQILLDYPQIEKYKLSFFPFWKKQVPGAGTKLSIELVF